MQIELAEPRIADYIRKNYGINRIYRQFTDDAHWYPYSIDESFIDVTHSHNLFGSNQEIATQIQKKVFDQFGIITKIHAINRSTKDAIKYIIDPLKTRNGELVEGVHCDTPTASFEFEMLADMSHRYNGNFERVGGRQVEGQHLRKTAKSYHLIQSFSPDDHVTPEEAHEIGLQLMRELIGDDYQFVIATHVDKDHIHNHIIFNAYSMTTLKKFRSQP